MLLHHIVQHIHNSSHSITAYNLLAMAFSKLRIFKKKTPEMITDSTYDQLRQLEQTQYKFLADMPEGPYPVFGIPLEDAAKLDDQFDNTSIFTPSYNNWENQLCLTEYQKYVPKFLFTCIKFVTNYGLKEEGLYRISGSHQDVRDLRDAFVQKGPNYEIPVTTDIHAITSLIKNFVRELPHPILPVTKCHTFLAYTPNDIPTELSFSQSGVANFSLFTAAEEGLNPSVIPTQILQEILQSLPSHNFALVQTLTRHFAAIVARQEQNRMSLDALSLILCPSLKIHKSVFHALVLKHDRIWADLHPCESEVSARGLKYDTRNILSYRQDEDTVFSTATASSNASFTDDNTTLSSISDPLMDPISLDLFTSAAMFDKAEHRRASMMLQPTEDEYDLFDSNAISFTGQIDYSNKSTTGPEGISLLSTTNTGSNRYSDILQDCFDYKLPLPSPQEYRYKQPTDKISSRYSVHRAVSAGVPAASNRTLFLRKAADV